MKILYGILTCEKYLLTRGEWIRDTWLKNIDDIDNHYFMSIKSDPSKNVLGFDVPDTYEGAPLKILNYVKYIVENEIDYYDWFHFSDDDCYIFPNRLKRQLQNYMDDEECVFCRKAELNNEQMDRFNIDKKSYYPGGGASYSMNRKSVQKLYNYIKNNNVDIHRNGDVSKGVWLYKAGIENLQHSELLGYTTPQELNHSIDRIKQNISYHFCDKDLFYELQNNF